MLIMCLMLLYTQTLARPATWPTITPSSWTVGVLWTELTTGLAATPGALTGARRVSSVLFAVETTSPLLPSGPCPTWTTPPTALHKLLVVYWSCLLFASMCQLFDTMVFSGVVAVQIHLFLEWSALWNVNVSIFQCTLPLFLSWICWSQSWY